MGRYTVKADSVIDSESRYYYPTHWNNSAKMREVAEMLNRLDSEGFRPRLRDGRMWFAKELHRHDGGDDGWVEVVHYIDPEYPHVNLIAVDVPSRRAIMFRLERLAQFAPDDLDKALAFAKDLARRAVFAAGTPYNPGEIAEMERTG